MARKFETRTEWLEATVDRFWSKVDRRGPDDCWLWIGTKMKPLPCGLIYGYFGVTDYKRCVSYRPHRLSWTLCNGRIPDGMVVMHTCDKPLCMNPNHLQVGTQADNMRDRDSKDRNVVGEEHWNSKFTEQDIIAIRTSDKTNTELASQYDAHSAHILRIRRGHCWKHVPMPESSGVNRQEKTDG